MRVTNGVAVVMPAYNARATIQAAIASALAQNEVTEVVVVDDASSDDTVAVARAADDGTGRLNVHQLKRNGGPSRARNVAIANSAAPLIAILDCDDLFTPNRFPRLLAVPGWDIIGDNVLFVGSPLEADQAARRLDGEPDGSNVVQLGFREFVEGNVSRPGQARRELGFLHPVVRRDFLERNRLRYDETMRLGEDYDLYARALAAGARFKLSSGIGYIAVERAGSLSVSHRAEDLGRLHAADARLLTDNCITASERQAVLRHRASVAGRWHLRRFLDAKRELGLLKAGMLLAKSPFATPAVVRGILRDKLTSYRTATRRGAVDRRPATLIPTTPIATQTDIGASA